MKNNKYNLNEWDSENPDNEYNIGDEMSDDEWNDMNEYYKEHPEEISPDRMTINKLTKVIKESIEKALNEKFNSKKLDTLNREHGGLKYPCYNSYLSDDEIGDITDTVTPNCIRFNDGTIVKTKLSPEHHRMFNSTMDNHPEFKRRFTRNNYTDGAKTYKWSNRDAGTMVQNAKPNKDGKYEIHHSWKEETPMDRLVGRNGKSDPLANWEQHFEDGNYSVNASGVRKAKADYATRKMSPKERHQYYKNKFGNRVIDNNEK